MVTKKYILGGGIAGLIWGFYNPDYLIVCPEENLGGQMNSNFSLGPRVIEYDEYTEKFLKDLNINFKIKTIKIGYYDKGFCKLTSELKNKYLLKSRGQIVKDPSCVNGGKEELKIIDVDFLEIINKLKKILVSRIINNKVERITSMNLFLLGNKILSYDEIINTIPLNIFFKLFDKNKELKSYPITYVKLKKDFFNMEDKNFIYFINKKFHRLSNHDDYIVAELFGNFSCERCKEIFKDKYLNSVCLKNSQIISLDKKPNYKRIFFSGRYGAWDRSYKINKVIEEAIKHG